MFASSDALGSNVGRAAIASRAAVDAEPAAGKTATRAAAAAFLAAVAAAGVANSTCLAVAGGTAVAAACGAAVAAAGRAALAAGRLFSSPSIGRVLVSLFAHIHTKD